jgi:sulfur carrier protein
LIEIQINGEKRSVDENLTVKALLELLGVPVAAVIVERNKQVVSRDQYGNEPVAPGDQLELIRLMGGG